MAFFPSLNAWGSILETRSDGFIVVKFPFGLGFLQQAHAVFFLAALSLEGGSVTAASVSGQAADSTAPAASGNSVQSSVQDSSFGGRGRGGGRGGRGGGGGGGGGGGSHSGWLCPLLGAIADALQGGEARAAAGQHSYAKVRARARAGGYLWDALVDAYRKDFAARRITLAHFMFDPRGHTHAAQQEVLLFPPGTPFSFRNLGRSSIPEEAFLHLILFVSQERGKAPLDPSAEGLAAARAALEAFDPPLRAEPEPLPAAPGAQQQRGGGGGGGGGGGAGGGGGRSGGRGGRGHGSGNGSAGGWGGGRGSPQRGGRP